MGIPPLFGGDLRSSSLLTEPPKHPSTAAPFSATCLFGWHGSAQQQTQTITYFSTSVCTQPFQEAICRARSAIAKASWEGEKTQLGVEVQNPQTSLIVGTAMSPLLPSHPISSSTSTPVLEGHS